MSHFGKIRCQVMELKYWCCAKQKTGVSVISRNIIFIICLYSGSFWKPQSGCKLHYAKCVCKYFKAVPYLMNVELISLPYPYVRSHNYVFMYA